ncbi:hypothetical protein CVT25_012681 [Psilocybe cyanescens]|uniref:Glycoside hydrolase family 5 domain-containing protein n=1 Tax=Psilocybe cyanescens TaxID=93625 RepID=A0A409VN26_PSICY|nr:hypothetical protein CVT25_012681 [Psilocybe cyanescens]
MHRMKLTNTDVHYLNQPASNFRRPVKQRRFRGAAQTFKVVPARGFGLKRSFIRPGLELFLSVTIFFQWKFATDALATMVHLNFSKLSALFAYDLKSVAYKPTPGSSLQEIGSLLAPNSSSQAAVAQFSRSFPRAGKESVTLRQRRKSDKQIKGLEADPSSCVEQSYDSPPILSQAFPPYDQTTANVFRYRQQQSVNLGSWFVHENWMTPSVFKCASGTKSAEIDIARGWGSTKSARAVLEQHWDTFIQSSDFEYLAGIGINTVRLPIGYWNLGPDYMQGTDFESVADVYTDCWPRVLRAINQAGDHGLGVLIDLHGAVGSQNGQPHSGISDGQTNLFNVSSNMDKTIVVLTSLAEQLATVNNIVGIQLLNEPQYDTGTVLEDFCMPIARELTVWLDTRAIEAMRGSSQAASHLPLYLHDGFDLNRFSNYVVSRKDFTVQDHHSYFVFSPSDQEESGTQLTVDVQDAIAKSLVDVSTKQRRNLVVDEWSCALTPSSLAKDKDAHDVQKKFCEEQMKVYRNATAGWAFWCSYSSSFFQLPKYQFNVLLTAYKTEDCDDDPGWCFKAAVGKTLPDNFFSYNKTKSIKAENNLVKNTSDLLIPTVSANILNLVQQVGLFAMDRRTSEDSLQYAGPRTGHRFNAIHHHRDIQNVHSDEAMKNSSLRGYSDGLTTAKVFAAYNMSRLGFMGQFMEDAIRVAGPTLIVQGTEDDYSSAFIQGLRVGEHAAMGGK